MSEATEAQKRYNEAYNNGVDRVIRILNHKLGMESKWLEHLVLDLPECDCHLDEYEIDECDIFRPTPAVTAERARLEKVHAEQVAALQKAHEEEIAAYRERGLLP